MATKQAHADRSAAVTGAQAVADAVQRVADAAVAEVQKAPPPEKADLTMVGSAGGRFVIEGDGFGTNGTVTVAGRQVSTFGWGSRRIEGNLPADVQDGEVVVNIDDKTTVTGQFKR